MNCKGEEELTVFALPKTKMKEWRRGNRRWGLCEAQREKQKEK